jgi:HAD superfamily phosphoserine phosphatase-like hydrolase
MSNTNPVAVFDFDGTLYRKDTMIQFCLFIYQKHPLRLRYAFIQMLGALLYAVRLISIEKFKTLFLSYLQGMDENQVRAALDIFWKERFPKQFHPEICQRLKEIQAQNISCLCLSASPDWMIQAACDHLGITHVMGSTVLFENGKWVWKFNCRGKKKVHFLENAYPSAVVLEAYSDNHDDQPLLKIAERGFSVKNGVALPFIP